MPQPGVCIDLLHGHAVQKCSCLHYGDIVMAYKVMAYIVMAYIVTAYIVMARDSSTAPSCM